MLAGHSQMQDNCMNGEEDGQLVKVDMSDYRVLTSKCYE